MSSRPTSLGRAARSAISAYLRTVLSPVERLTQLVGKGHLFDETMSSYRDRTITDHGIVFDASHPRLVFRATHFADQEPELLRWIEARFERDEVFYDIGANIGYFSIYAATNTGVRVYAFEPESLTFASLNRNIFYNRVSDQVIALPVALSNTETVAFLHLRDFVPGNAYNTFGTAIDFRGNEFRPQFRQGSVGMTLDYFLEQFGAPAPQHIKIDVDGNEADIIAGMAKTLSAPTLRTLCIELTPERPDQAAIIRTVQDAGFRENPDFIHQERASVGTRNYYFER